MNLIEKAGTPTCARVGLKGSLVVIDWQKMSRGMELNWKEAQRFADAIFRQSQKAERKEKGILPTKKEVDQFMEKVGSPTIVQPPALSAGEIARGKPYGL